MAFSTTDTIVAVATPPGRGGIGVVRISGPDARRVAGDLITRADDIQAPTPAQLRRGYAAGPMLISVTRGPRHHVLALKP